MALTVTDVRDLLQILREHPEWKAEVRREILGEELLSLPELVRETTLAVRQNSAAIAALTEAVHQNSVDIAQNSAHISRLEASISLLEVGVAELVRVTNEHGEMLHRHGNDLGYFRGRDLEWRYRRAPQIVIHRRLRKMRTLEPRDLTLFEDAIERGELAGVRADAVYQLDLMVQGREGSGDDARDAILAVEISGTISERDISRAVERAATLRSVGYNAYPAVAGKAIGKADRRLAEESGVEVYIESPEGEEEQRATEPALP